MNSPTELGIFYWLDKLSEEECANLPPLVKKGEDREQVLREIVEKWCTPSEVEGTDHLATDAHVENGGFVLSGVAFVDENTGEPIDLAELLRDVEKFLRANGEPKDFRGRPDLLILIERCRIDSCSCHELAVRPRFVARNTKFCSKADFKDARFGGEVSFSHATFGDEVIFQSAEFGDETNFINVTFGERADFSLARFGDCARFYQGTFGNDASFYNACFGDQTNFSMARFGDRAFFGDAYFGNEVDFSQAKFSKEARFWEASFGGSADFHKAWFGDGADLRWVRFGRVGSFVHTHLPNADLRDTRGFVPDETFTRGAHFSARAEDPWSKLRADFTGPRLIFNLLFLSLFFLPFIARTVGYYTGGQMQEQVLMTVQAMDAQLTAEEGRHPELVSLFRTQLEAIQQRLPGVSADHWRESSVWKAVIGIDRGIALWLPAVLLLLYNIGRGFMTFVVAPMRDAEERSGYTPTLKVRGWKEVRGAFCRENGVSEGECFKSPWAPWRFVVLTWRWLPGFGEAYGWLIWPHRILVALFWFAVLSFLSNAIKWLSMPVWLPA